MKYLATLIMMMAFGTYVIAAPGGNHHKITEYDYHDYVNSEIQSKTFVKYENGVALDMVWTFARPKPMEVERTEITTDASGSITRYVVSMFTATAKSFDWTQLDIYSGSVTQPILTETRLYIPPVAVLTDAMVPGIAWGTAGTIDSMNDPDDYFTDKNEVLAVEDVTVPAGSYNDCLKIHRVRQYFSSTGTRTEWYCPDMGLVKSVHGGARMFELTGVTLNN